MPLWRPYDAMIEGTVGDISNSGSGGGMRGLDHRGAVPSPLRRQGEILGAFRRLRLEPEAARPWARGRRDPGRAGFVRAVERALSEAVTKGLQFGSKSCYM